MVNSDVERDFIICSPLNVRYTSSSNAYFYWHGSVVFTALDSRSRGHNVGLSHGHFTFM